MGKNGFEEAKFLNIDLVVKARQSLAPLAVVWPWAQPRAQAYGRSKFPNWLVLSPRGDPKTAEFAARRLLAHVETLSPAARRCWDRASTRTFDIGLQADIGPRAFEEVQLTSKTLGRIAAVGGRIQVTVYPPHRD